MANKHMKMNPVVHFEMPAKDKKRMADFYTNVFGWKTQMLGPEMGNYVLATTTESDKTGRPKNPAPSMAASSQSRRINPRNILPW